MHIGKYDTNDAVLPSLNFTTGNSSVEKHGTVVWTCLPSTRSGQNHLARHSERGKKTKKRWADDIREQIGLDFAKSQRAV